VLQKQNAVSFDPMMLEMWSKGQFHQILRHAIADFKYVIFSETFSEKYLQLL